MSRTMWLAAAVLAGLAVLVAFPQIDLTVSALFHRPGYSGGFPLRLDPWCEFARKRAPYGLFALAGLVALLGLAAALRRRPLLGVTWRGALAAVLSLALGPGLIINQLLKDNWGRARPSQIAEFGGTAHFTRALLPTDQCVDNCSFASGHAALGFWLVSVALLAPPRWRPAAIAVALAGGGLMGLARIAQGGHFLSDVVFAAAITVGVAFGLHNLIAEPARRPPTKKLRADTRDSS